MDYQKLLVEHLELIDRVVRYIARRRHLSAPDAEEFSSVVRYKLIDHDYAILRKFEGRSNLATYLTTVVERLYLDFCIARWGKWRPSAAAQRGGPLAVLLEQLIARDGLTFDEAVSTLQTNHSITASRGELRALLGQLPLRAVRRLASEEELALAIAHTAAVDPAHEAPDDADAIARVERVLARALEKLSPHDRLVLKLRFQDGMAVTDIGRLLRVPAKPIYRKLQENIAFLHGQLLQEGIDAKDVARIVGHPALTLGGMFGDVGEPDDGSV